MLLAYGYGVGISWYHKPHPLPAVLEWKKGNKMDHLWINFGGFRRAGQHSGHVPKAAGSLNRLKTERLRDE